MPKAAAELDSEVVAGNSGVFRKLNVTQPPPALLPRAVVAQGGWSEAEALAALLVTRGYDVEQAHTQAGLERALSSGSVRYLVTDTHLDEREVISLVAAALNTTPTLQVLFVSQRTDRETLRAAAATGAVGFVQSPCSDQQLLASVAVGFAAAPAPTSVERDLLRAHEALKRIQRVVEEAGVSSSGGPTFDSFPKSERLSEREWSVLRLLVGHRRPRAIAKELGISPHTVRNHLKRMFVKLGVNSQEELLALAIQQSR